MKNIKTVVRVNDVPLLGPHPNYTFTDYGVGLNFRNGQPYGVYNPFPKGYKILGRDKKPLIFINDFPTRLRN